MIGWLREVLSPPRRRVVGSAADVGADTGSEFPTSREAHGSAEVARHIEDIGRNSLVFAILATVVLIAMVVLAIEGMERQQRRADDARLQILELQADLSALSLTVGEMRLGEKEVLAQAGRTDRAVAALGRWNASVDEALGSLDDLGDTSGASSSVAETLAAERDAIAVYAEGASRILEEVATNARGDRASAELALLTLDPYVRDVEQSTVRTQREIGAFGIEMGREARADTRAALIRLLVVAGLLVLLLAASGIALRRRSRNSVETLGRLSLTDPLTGLLNRAGLRAGLDGRSEPNPARYTALLYLDLDHFGLVSDVAGHEQGDELLVEVADRLRTSLGSDDLLARVGSDEFAAFVTRNDADELSQLAQTLLVQVRQLGFTASDCSFPLSASIGSAQFSSGASFGKLMRGAAEACRTAKSTGRDRVHIASSGDLDTMSLRVLMSQAGRVHTLMEEGSLRLVRQNMVNLHGGQDRCELLVRAIDPATGETINPASIIPAAETFGLISTIDRWTLCAALLCIEGGLLDPYEQVGINLSSGSITSAEFSSFVDRQLRAHPAAAARISVEVRESAVVASPGHIREFVEVVHAAKGHVAVDDFGSGVASFGLLHSVRFDTMKIAGGVVQKMGSDPSVLELARALVNVARTHRMDTVGCMVESAADLGTLRRLGVGFAQGFGVAGTEEIEAGELWSLAASLAGDDLDDIAPSASGGLSL